MEGEGSGVPGPLSDLKVLVMLVGALLVVAVLMLMALVKIQRSV